MEARKTLCPLAQHELECLKMAQLGMSNEAIARAKCVQKVSVEQMFHNIYAKLDISMYPPSAKRQLAIRIAEENGWISSENA